MRNELHLVKGVIMALPNGFQVLVIYARDNLMLMDPGSHEQQMIART